MGQGGHRGSQTTEKTTGVYVILKPVYQTDEDGNIIKDLDELFRNKQRDEAKRIADALKPVSLADALKEIKKNEEKEKEKTLSEYAKLYPKALVETVFNSQKAVLPKLFS